MCIFNSTYIFNPTRYWYEFRLPTSLWGGLFVFHAFLLTEDITPFLNRYHLAISFITSLLLANYFRFCLSKNVFIPFSVFPDIFTLCRILTWQFFFFSFSTLEMSPFVFCEVKVKVTQLCPTLCDPLDYIGHRIFQARIPRVGRLSLLQEIFPTQGKNPSLLHWREILYQLSHKGSPRIILE